MKIGPGFGCHVGIQFIFFQHLLYILVEIFYSRRRKRNPIKILRVFHTEYKMSDE